MCLKGSKSCFPDCCKVSSVVPVFKNAEERSTAKNYRPVSLLSVVSKVFEKLVQVWATRAVALDISKAFDRVWHASLLHKLKSCGFSGQILDFISYFLSNRRLWVVLDLKSSQEYPVNAGVPQGFILGSTLFLLYINDLAEDVIYSIAIYADDTTLFSKFDQASDLWQQLELASELESDLRVAVYWGRTWLVDFNAGKTRLVSFDRSNNTGTIDMKMDGSVLEENSALRG